MVNTYEYITIHDTGISNSWQVASLMYRRGATAEKERNKNV